MLSMNVVNGFVSVDTSEDEGVILETKCGELQATRKIGYLLLRNNFEKGISYTEIKNNKKTSRSINPNESISIEIQPGTDFKIYFGVPLEEERTSFTCIWGETYFGNATVLGIFYSVANPV